MPTPETFATFLIALTLLELSPGPDMMMVMARGLEQGRFTGLVMIGLGVRLLLSGSANGGGFRKS